MYFVKIWSGKHTAGVAVAMKGAPLMKLFKAKEPERSEEDEAAAMRLMAITNRMRPGSLPGPTAQDTPEQQQPEQPEDPQ
ncbi:MAG TPA: hypothetical protein VF067_00070 [Sphingomicrobium sp.]